MAAWFGNKYYKATDQGVFLGEYCSNDDDIDDDVDGCSVDDETCFKHGWTRGQLTH